MAVLVACAPPREIVPVTSVPVRSDTTARPAVTPPTQAALLPYADVPTGRFDGGKMWTFDNPPVAYFQEEYGLTVDSLWLARARGASLRFGTGCSASFVSAMGLIMTNHHCARESITEVEEEGEGLLDAGFLATSRAEERAVEDLYVDRLMAIDDVTAEVYALDRADMPPSARAAERDRQAEALGSRLTAEAKATDSTRVVEVVPLYNGGRYAAYTYERLDDVRLVMAPELQVGFFGGDWDNFTYPRYNLDVAFFRAYDKAGRPIRPSHYFRWSDDGAAEGDPVFVVGSGGSTSRLATVSQLEYLRDHELPATLTLLDKRARILREYVDANPEEADAYDLRNAYFSLQNTRKSLQGQLDGLQSDWLIPRKGAAELALQQKILQSDSLSAEYRSVFGELAAVQLSKEASLETAQAFAFFLNPSLSSRILARAMYGYVLTLIRQRGAPPQQRAEIREEALEIESFPPELEKQLIALRISELRDALGPQDASVRRLLGDSTPEEVAALLVDSTALKDSSSFRVLLDKNYLTSGDASVEAIEVIAPLYFTQNQQLESFEEREQALNSRLGRARFAVYGHEVPPDATFSPRLSDGRVLAYEVDGYAIPPFTTYFGLYERFYASSGQSEWTLPERWIDAPATFDRSTPLNLVSTNDITGGNSGSPLLNADLEIVGLIFDSNMQALPNEFIYTDGQARSVSVDSRGILAALVEVYGAHDLAGELLRGMDRPAEEAGGR
ncbi:MAG: S46 family peptidase [Rhodothermales bacterium]|nr:S46 family peptidase [Rhodothermales bacterium]